MRYRIIRDGNGRYYVQSYSSWFSGWTTHIDSGSPSEAEAAAYLEGLRAWHKMHERRRQEKKLERTQTVIWEEKIHEP